MNHSGTYNYCRLKTEIKNELLGAYFGGDYGAALAEIPDLERLTGEELLQIANNLGISVSKYKQ